MLAAQRHGVQRAYIELDVTPDKLSPVRALLSLSLSYLHRDHLSHHSQSPPDQSSMPYFDDIYGAPMNYGDDEDRYYADLDSDIRRLERQCKWMQLRLRATQDGQRLDGPFADEMISSIEQESDEEDEEDEENESAESSDDEGDDV